MRKTMIAGNWKMNMLPEQAVSLVGDIWLRTRDKDEVEVVVCPPFILIPAISELLLKDCIDMGLGAQNMHWEESGAYTGEVSPLMLGAFGVTHVILGHSERRHHFAESDQGVNRKVRAAIRHGIAPILCVGETLKERESGDTEHVVINQLKRGLFEVEAESMHDVVVAYEPVWAIGTGRAATAEDADEVTGLIRRTIDELHGPSTADAARILYGGSVNPDNVCELLSMPNIDGALVGGASLKAEDFSKLVSP